jgi:hypothetical protein
MPLRQAGVGADYDNADYDNADYDNADYDNVAAAVDNDSVELPEPRDDGAADHLAGQSLPAIELASTAGHQVRIDSLAGRSVIFVYPAIGGPVSNQAAPLQREHVDRLGLRYPLPSDESMQLADTPGLPIFEFDGQRYYTAPDHDHRRRHDHVSALPGLSTGAGRRPGPSLDRADAVMCINA